MDKEARQDLNDSVKELLAKMKLCANVYSITANALGLESNYISLRKFDLAIVDELGIMTKAEFCLIVATLDIDNIIAISNKN